MKRFPSSRWASTIQIVRPSRLIAETQPKLHPAFFDIVSEDFPILHASRLCFPSFRNGNRKSALQPCRRAKSPFVAAVALVALAVEGMIAHNAHSLTNHEAASRNDRKLQSAYCSDHWRQAGTHWRRSPTTSAAGVHTLTGLSANRLMTFGSNLLASNVVAGIVGAGRRRLTIPATVSPSLACAFR